MPFVWPTTNDQRPMTGNWLAQLNREVIACTRCPRLVAYREQIAREKRRAYFAGHQFLNGPPEPSLNSPATRRICFLNI